jgi:hypothetical protein
MLHPAQSPAQYKIRAIHQVPSRQNGYVAVFTAYINEYRQMWCNVSPSDPARLEMGYTDTEPTYLGSEVLYTNNVFVALEYSELTYSQLCEIIEYNGKDWSATDLQNSGVYAPNYKAKAKAKKRTRATRLKIASILCRRAIANIRKLEAIIKERTAQINERLDAKYPNRCKC